MEMKEMNMRQKLDFISICIWLGDNFSGATSTEQVYKSLVEMKQGAIKNNEAILSEIDKLLEIVDEFQRRCVNEQ